MEPFVIILSLILVAFLVYMFFFRNNKKSIEKSYYLKRFLRNKEHFIRHINQVQALSRQNEGQDKKAFPDKEVTFAEYLYALNSKYESDYSDSTYHILKKNRLSNSQKQEYSKKLIEQSEDLYLMEVELGILNKAWRKEVS